MQRRMMLLSDDESGRREADAISKEITVLAHRAARLEVLASASPSSLAQLHQNQQQSPRQQPQPSRQKLLKRARSSNGNPCAAAVCVHEHPHKGRVDVFHATEFHGGPFQQYQQKSNHIDGARAPRRPESCGGSRMKGTSCVGTSQSSLSTTRAGIRVEEVLATGDKGGRPYRSSDVRGEDKKATRGRPWTSKMIVAVM